MSQIKKPFIFIVEDNEMYAEMIKFNLDTQNYNSEIFHSGESCLSEIYRNPDIIVLDYMLGSMDGIDVLKQVKSINPDIQVVFLSGQEDLNIGINSLKYGAYDYVIKDESAFPKLLNTLNTIIELNKVVEKKYKFPKPKFLAGILGASIATVSLIFQYIN